MSKAKRFSARSIVARASILGSGVIVLMAFQNCGKFDSIASESTIGMSSTAPVGSANSAAPTGSTPPDAGSSGSVTSPPAGGSPNASTGFGTTGDPSGAGGPTVTSSITSTGDLEKFLTSWDALMVPRSLATSGLVTSYDRAGSNMDYGNFLGMDNGRAILFDQDGPGIVNKIWTAYTFQCGKLYFYFDGETSPSRTYTPQQIFDGNQVPFLKPVAANNYDSSGGNFSLILIPFRKHLKITADIGGFCYSYYQVGFYQLNGGVLDRGFDDVENSAQAAAWKLAGSGYPGSLTTTRTIHAGAFTLNPGATTTVLSVAPSNSTAVLKSLVLITSGVGNAPGATPQTQAFENTWVHVSWDDGTEAIAAPLPMFFGAGKSVGFVKALAYGLDGGTGYFDLPMPFTGHAKITLENRSAFPLPVSDVEFQINDTANADPGLRLRGSYRSTLTVKDHNTTFLSATGGAGHMVSFVYDFGSRGTILEGDDTTIVDKKTLLHGTGTEDVFLGAWYFNQGDFSLPSNGAVNGAAYRSYLNDAVVFTSSIDFSMEHDNVNEGSGEPVRGLVLWYGGPGVIDQTPGQ